MGKMVHITPTIVNEYLNNRDLDAKINARAGDINENIIEEFKSFRNPKLKKLEFKYGDLSGELAFLAT